MFDVIVLKDGAQAPEHGTYYIVAKQGIFLHKENDLVEAIVPVDRISILRPVQEYAQLKLPKISPELFGQAVSLFREVYRLLWSEAVLLLHYHQEKKEYAFTCPEQEVSGSSVNYDASERIEGWESVGTIHSHPSFSAFHSGTDRFDEQDVDGIHVTVGHVNQKHFSVKSSVVVNGQRYPMDSCDVIAGLLPVDWRTYSVIKTKEAELASNGLAQEVSIPGNMPKTFRKEVKTTTVEPQQFYDLILPNHGDYRKMSAPDHWIAKVKKISYVKYGAKPSASAPAERFRNFDDYDIGFSTEEWWSHIGNKGGK